MTADVYCGLRIGENGEKAAYYRKYQQRRARIVCREAAERLIEQAAACREAARRSKVDMEYLSIVIGCFVGLAGWLLGRDKKLSAESQWKGEVNAKLDSILGIRGDIDDLRDELKRQGERIATTEASARSAHKRLDSMEVKQSK